MYLEYWNLREDPFQNVEDARFAYLSDQHHEGLARLVYLVQNRRLGGVLTGPYGVGKTMVLQLLAQQLSQEGDTHFVKMDYIAASSAALARYLLSSMGYDDGRLEQVHEAMDGIRILRKDQRSLTHTTLVLDEAQAIRDPEVYHFLHLLTNISLLNAAGQPSGAAFTIILSGYDDMTTLLATDESLCQRLQLYWQLEPLDARQTLEYVQHRIRVAGGDIWIFEAPALDRLHEAAGGLPRKINNICDIALMLGYAANVRHIDADIMGQAIHDALLPMAKSPPRINIDQQNEPGAEDGQ